MNAEHSVALPLLGAPTAAMPTALGLDPLSVGRDVLNQACRVDRMDVDY